MKIDRKWMSLALGASLVAGLLAGPALAQETDESAQEQTEQADESAGGRPGKARFKEVLAENLGITVEELEAAMEATHEQLREEFEAAALERIDEAVAEGRITEEEAEKLRQRIEDGELPRPGRGRGGLHRGFRDGPFGGRSGPGADGASVGKLPVDPESAPVDA